MISGKSEVGTERKQLISVCSAGLAMNCCQAGIAWICAAAACPSRTPASFLGAGAGPVARTNACIFSGDNG